jgi:inorganic pyrophosphatase
MAENFHCLVEIPKGSRNKYEWDEELQAIKLDRFLFASVVYPTDYGFIPQTLGEDGDPLDAMVVVTEPTFPGCMIPVKVIALFRMRDDKGVDDKVVCVPQHDPNWRHVEKLEDLSVTLRDEISHFFSIYKQPEGIAVKVDGWFPRDQAIEIIEAAKARYRDEGGGQPEAGPPPGEGDGDDDADAEADAGTGDDAETEDAKTEDDTAEDGDTAANSPPSDDAADPKS